MSRYSEALGCYVCTYKDPATRKVTIRRCKDIAEVEAFKREQADLECGQARLPYVD